MISSRCGPALNSSQRSETSRWIYLPTGSTSNASPREHCALFRVVPSWTLPSTSVAEAEEVEENFKLLAVKRRDGPGRLGESMLKLESSGSNPSACSGRLLQAEWWPAAVVLATTDSTPSLEGSVASWRRISSDVSSDSSADLPTMLPTGSLPRRLFSACLDQQVGVADAVLLDPLNEETFVSNLLARFKRDYIYTYIGNVLISINPYKPLTLYTPEVIEIYKSRTFFELPPHVYALADCAWRSLRDFHRDQVIIITGESGAGKTEASKLILQYITAASSTAPSTSPAHLRDLELIQQQLLLSNPLLEAFGNAKTHRNDNSSRFGKYMEIEFDHKGAPLGGLITNYLLEKSRVTVQNPGERNFHIFYQLLAGADVQLLKSLKLQRNADNYHYLKNSRSGGGMEMPSGEHGPFSATDKEDFQITKKAMEALGFSVDDVISIFRIVAAVLKLGNMVFSPVSNMDGTEGCAITNEYELEEVSMLLSCPVEDLRCALLYRNVNLGFTSTLNVDQFHCAINSRDSTMSRTSPSRTFAAHPRASFLSNSASMCGRELYDVAEFLRSEAGSIHGAMTTRTAEAKSDVVMTDLSAVEATYARDTLCKALYHRLFTWLVNSINDKIKVKLHGKRKVLGLVDIYGFEVLERNSFEQFIINFCNEKLQQVFVELTLKEEQQEYVQEGLEWTPIVYFDNSAICDLIEKSNQGILSVLDDECQRPGHVTDDTFLRKLSDALQGHPHFETRVQQQKSNVTDHTLPLDAFRLKHYAGSVTYSVTGFVDKNNDLLFRDLSQAMYHCNHPILKELFPEGNPRRTTLRRPATAGSQFKMSVNALMKSLSAKVPHYVRCVKPNDLRQANLFEATLVQHQVRYLGLMENVHVRRAGFAYRQTYSAFLQRYKMTSALTWPDWSGTSIEGVARLLRDLHISATEYAFGRTKIFIKNPRTVIALEDYRRVRLEDLATLIQKTFRCWSAQRHFRKLRQSQIIIATTWRRFKARKEFMELRHQRRIEWAVRVIERAFITWRRRRYLNRLSVRLPAYSPLCREWPSVTPLLRETNAIIKKIFHKWRCHRYRLQFDQIGRNRMREKVTASFLFRNRKESYPRSVGHPFQGDYVRLRQNTQWRRMVADTLDNYVVFADIVSKISRSSGRLVPVLFVVTTSSMMLLDQRTLNVKYRVPASDVVRISLSPYLDDIAVFHVKSFGSSVEARSVQNLPGCLFQAEPSGSASVAHASNMRKGDLVLQTCHVIELVTKTFLVVQNAAGKAPDVNVSTDFEANFGQLVDICFRCVGLPEVQPGQIRIIRRGARMEVIL